MTAYANTNFKTKKALKEAVANHQNQPRINGVGYYPVRAHQAGLGPDLSNYTGRVAISGPHYPAAHTWYAECELRDGIVIKVK